MSQSIIISTDEVNGQISITLTLQPIIIQFDLHNEQGNNSYGENDSVKEETIDVKNEYDNAKEEIIDVKNENDNAKEEGDFPIVGYNANIYEDISFDDDDVYEDEDMVFESDFSEDTTCNWDSPDDEACDCDISDDSICAYCLNREISYGGNLLLEDVLVEDFHFNTDGLLPTLATQLDIEENDYFHGIFVEQEMVDQAYQEYVQRIDQLIEYLQQDMPDDLL